MGGVEPAAPRLVPGDQRPGPDRQGPGIQQAVIAAIFLHGGAAQGHFALAAQQIGLLQVAQPPHPRRRRQPVRQRRRRQGGRIGQPAQRRVVGIETGADPILGQRVKPQIPVQQHAFGQRGHLHVQRHLRRLRDAPDQPPEQPADAGAEQPALRPVQVEPAGKDHRRGIHALPAARHLAQHGDAGAGLVRQRLGDLACQPGQRGPRSHPQAERQDIGAIPDQPRGVAHHQGAEKARQRQAKGPVARRPRQNGGKDHQVKRGLRAPQFPRQASQRRGRGRRKQGRKPGAFRLRRRVAQRQGWRGRQVAQPRAPPAAVRRLGRVGAQPAQIVEIAALGFLDRGKPGRRELAVSGPGFAFRDDAGGGDEAGGHHAWRAGTAAGAQHRGLVAPDPGAAALDRARRVDCRARRSAAAEAAAGFRASRPDPPDPAFPPAAVPASPCAARRR